MAENGTREVIGNPLALNPREQAPDRSLPLQGVRGNSSTDNQLFRETDQIVGAMGGLRRVLSEAAIQRQEEAQTQGKIDFMQGMTELQIRETGDYHRIQGYESLNAVNKANQWYAEELQNLAGAGADMTPEEYREHLAKQNKTLFDSMPEDPGIRNIYTAAYSDIAPRLAARHVELHNERNYERQEQAVGTYMQSGGRYSADATRREGPSDFSVSDSIVSTVYTSSDARDRDIAIKTMLGEAGGESDQGLAAVAHVLKNRSGDSRWGGSIADVALAPKQFSTWNEGAGGNNPGRYKPGTPAYERAGRIYDAVISGHHVDPTNGATHYYSPAGMDLLVREGSQTNRLPRWLEQERRRSGGEVRLGGHIFVGRANGAGSNSRRAQGPMLEDAPNDAGIQRQAVTESPTYVLSNARPFKENEFVQNDDGSISTERTVTIQDAEGKYVNVPSLWMVDDGYVDFGDDETQIRNMLVRHERNGGSFERFDSVEDAEESAKARSNAGGASVTQGSIDAAHEGIATAETTPVASTEFQATVREQAARLRPGRAAAMLADTIATQLSVGDTTALDNSGGIAFLQEIGASSDDINKVIRAQDAYEKGKENEFSEEREMFRRDLIDWVKANPDADYETEVLPRIRAGMNMGAVTDAGARALANEAANAMAAEGRRSMKDNPQLLSATNGKLRAFQQLDPASMSDEEYAAATDQFAVEMEQIVKDYGGNASDVADFIGRVYSLSNQRLNQMETEVKREQDKARENATRAAAVDQRIFAGQGVADLTGRITYNGVEYDSEGYYVARLRNTMQQNLSNQYTEEQIRENAEAIDVAADNEFFSHLIRAGVMDKQTGATMNASIRGNIVENGVVSEAAVSALDQYMRISRLEGGSAYLGKLLDQDARALYASAAEIYGGDVSLEQALRMMKGKEERIRTDPSYVRELDSIAERDIAPAARRAKDDALSNGFVSKVMGTTLEVNPVLLAQSDAHIEGWLRNKATTLQMNEPILSAETAVTQARESLEEQSVIVGSNFVIAPRPELRLDRVMGVESYGRQTPDTVIRDFISENGEAIWGQLWTDRKPATGIWQGQREIGSGFGPRRERLPEYYVQSVTQPDGSTAISIALLKEPNNPGAGIVGTPYVIADAARLGAEWIRKQNESTFAGGILNSVRQFFGRGLPETLNQVKEDNPVEQQRDTIRERLGF